MLMCTTTSASPIMAQQTADIDTGTTVFGRADAATAVAFVLGTAALMPLDRRIALESQRPSLQNNRALGDFATAFRLIGEPGSIAMSAATYVVGRAEHSPRAAELGLRAFESIGAAGVTAVIIKGIVGRARPFVVADTNPTDYRPGRGFHEDSYTSFPSGHATSAFAAASAASQEISYLWPHASHLWTPALFTSATLVGFSRVYNDKHWASDVMAGAAVGTIAGRIVVRYQRAHPRNSIDRLLLPIAVGTHTGKSVSFAWGYAW